MSWFLDLPHSLQAAIVLTLFACGLLLAAHRLGAGAVRALACLAPVLAALPAAITPTNETFAVLGVLGLALIAALLLRADDLESPSHAAEVGSLLLLGTAGAGVLATASNLLSILLGFETMSLAVAVMAGLGRGPRALEAAFKFFVLAAAGVAALVYGLGLHAYATGSFQLGAPALEGPLHGTLLTAGVVLIALGIAFEVALVPIHFGALGIYFAAPLGCTGFAMTVSKLGAVVALSRLAAAHPQLEPVLVGLGVVSIVWATFAGLAQTHLRGMLAYSAVAHGGFMALALGCGDAGRKAALFYAVVYVASAALVVASVSGARGDLPFASLRQERFGRLRAIGLVVGLLSLAGVPPSPGFWAKLAVLGPSWNVAGPFLTIVAVLGGVFGALYYLKPVPDVIARLRADAGTAGGDATPSSRLAIVLAGGVTALFCVMPFVAARFVG